MPGPQVLAATGFQEVWLTGVALLLQTPRVWNLVVHVQDPSLFDQLVGSKVSDFAHREGLVDPLSVSHTILPPRPGLTGREFEAYCSAFNRPGGPYDRLKRRHPRWWGTYFRRLTHYDVADGVVNQLERVVRAIRCWRVVPSGAFALVIPRPGPDTARFASAPCLNFIAVQYERATHSLGLLCVYRKHDFLKMAYGNYWGLCKLALFLCDATGARPAPVTCISSHAYLSDGVPRSRLRALVKECTARGQ